MSESSILVLTSLLDFELGLFTVGFVFGLTRGNRKTHWLLRALGCGLIFAFFYIVLPSIAIHERFWQPPAKDVTLPPELGMKYLQYDTDQEEGRHAELKNEMDLEGDLEHGSNSRSPQTSCC